LEISDIGGGVIAASGAVLAAIANHKVRPREGPAPPFELSNPSPAASCEHEWFDQDEMLNYDPKCYRSLKRGETR
jgi:hypothetical protein